MTELTCKDCQNSNVDNSGHEFCDVLLRSIDKCRLCQFFVGDYGKRPRFCRLASSIDEMAAALVYPVEWEYQFVGSEEFFKTEEDAKAAAKQYLMEVE